MKTSENKSKKSASVLVDSLADLAGKIPPQAPELEQAVLGAIMLENNALTEVIELLNPEMFYVPANQIIFKAIQSLFNESKPVDTLTVTDKLQYMGELENAGGSFYVVQLTNRISSSANTEYHSRIVIEKFIKRKLIEVSSNTIEESYKDSTDVLDLLDDAQEKLFDLTEQNFKSGTEGISPIIKKTIEEIEHARSQGGGLNGVPSGYTEIDDITGGWQKSDLIILAARPGMGKTAFALSMLRNMAIDHQKSVAIFSLEMSKIQLVTRLISSEVKISADKLRQGKVSDDEFKGIVDNVSELSKSKIFIDDSAGLTIFELRAKCRKLKKNNNIDFVVIDYLQLMSAGSEKDNRGNREQEISKISRGIKSLAKELNIPILTLSQLSRAVETRGGEKKPILSDLRESGSIEQDADIVMFIWRPDYYEKEKGDGLSEINIAKHRNGKTRNDIKLKFVSSYARFENPAYNDLDVFDTDEFATIPSKLNSRFQDPF